MKVRPDLAGALAGSTPEAIAAMRNVGPLDAFTTKRNPNVWKQGSHGPSVMGFDDPDETAAAPLNAMEKVYKTEV